MTEAEEASDGYVDPKTVPFTAPQRDGAYRMLINHLSSTEVKSLCSILLHKRNEIFTLGNLQAIERSSTIRIGEGKYPVLSCSMKYLLRMINYCWKKDDILKDLADKLEESDLKKNVNKYLGGNEGARTAFNPDFGLNGD